MFTWIRKTPFRLTQNTAEINSTLKKNTAFAILLFLVDDRLVKTLP